MVRHDFSKEFPELFAPGEFDAAFADQHRIDQVVTNLLTNTAKYAPESEMIALIVDDHGTQLKVSVSDQGRAYRGKG